MTMTKLDRLTKQFDTCRRIDCLQTKNWFRSGLCCTKFHFIISTMSIVFFIKSLMEENNAYTVKILSDPATLPEECYRSTHPQRKPRSKSCDDLNMKVSKQRHPKRISSLSRWDNAASAQTETLAKVTPPVRVGSPSRAILRTDTDTTEVTTQATNNATCDDKPLSRCDNLPQPPMRQESMQRTRSSGLQRQCSWASSA
jgi:hypothetical protein